MTHADRFKCAACGFKVFNRRASACESCKVPLPTDMAYTADEMALIAQEEQRTAKIRKDLERQARALEAEKEKRRGNGG